VRLDLADDPDPPSIAIFCPACVEREFRGCLPKGDGGTSALDGGTATGP
jgi:hypothetical protein